MDKIIINGKEFESFAEAHKTGMYSYEDLGGVERFDDEADVFIVEFPDGSWCIHFNIKGLKKWTKNI